jgi:predicted glutamine amidotransferase
VCEVMAVAWQRPEEVSRILPWACELERLGVAGFGWGVAWLEGGGRVQGYRFPGALADDTDGVSALSDVESTRFLIHLRRPNRLSTVQLADTQPFVEEEGRFAFCHNGSFERHDEFRSQLAGRLGGRADSEVGFRLFEDLIAVGGSPPDALAETHGRLDGHANLGYLGSDGELLVYAANPSNPVWRFEIDGARVAATSLHSLDSSLFDLMFPDAALREEVVDGTASLVAAASTANGTG